MKVVDGIRDDQLRVLNENNMMAGLITKDITMAGGGISEPLWRIEMLMCIEGTASTREEAIAFAHGVWAAAQVWGPLRTAPPAQGVPLRGPPTIHKPQPKGTPIA